MLRDVEWDGKQLCNKLFFNGEIHDRHDQGLVQGDEQCTEVMLYYEYVSNVNINCAQVGLCSILAIRGLFAIDSLIKVMIKSLRMNFIFMIVRFETNKINA